ncbi:MAG TPA: hypothetical protein VM621_04320 [Luteibacter sp.]|uniref:hypothetical protein n=1 Tax=Luteibacter sp. TaxID=1886636 RepID=UPI002C9639DE|nr:hypothetical protein [Luteibacter sp.]HVI54267.1 hypothetical protein [Luteibacter sp.]
MSAWAADIPADDPLMVEARYRYSNLHSDGTSRRGHAHTFRARLGYRWTLGHGWSLYGEGIGTASLFGRQYDDGSGQRPSYPAEADPASTGVSNAWVGYRSEAFAFRGGRQYVRLDNGRFFSNNLWRQNLQSFDGLHLAWKAWQGAELGYYWLGRVNRTLGADFHDRDQRRWKLDAHLLHMEQGLPLGTLVAYGYFVRNDTLATRSVKTFGVRWTGKHVFGDGGATLGWAGELARQHDYANNPSRYGLGYSLFEASYGYAPLAARLGEERLGGNGRQALDVAYGAARAFNGWVVAFRVPASGVHERHMGLMGAANLGRKVDWQLTYRHFRAATNGALLGHEVDAGLAVTLGGGFSLDFQYGDYRAARHGVDERKFWVVGEYRFGAAAR